MIRVIILLIGAFIVWVLFFSKFSKANKIALVSLAAVLSFLGVWFESSAGKPQVNIVKPNQVISCGVNAKHTYRTNFDINLCVQNTTESGRVRRLELSVVAEHCGSSTECVELQRVTRSLSVDIEPKSSTSLVQNLNFSEVEPSLQGVQWSFIVHSVKANK